MKQKSKELNSRQWSLYNFLKEQYADGVYISKKEICKALPQYYTLDNKATRLCRDIEHDIRVINESTKIQKIIVSNRKGYKIGNKDEVDDYLSKRTALEVKSRNLTKKLKIKAKLDGQMKLTLGTNERDVIEAFPR